MDLVNNIVIRISCKTCKYVYNFATITPMRCSMFLKLSQEEHPYFEIREHLSEKSHSGFESKILHYCSSKTETLRITELEAIKNKISVPNMAKHSNGKHIIEFVKNDLNKTK